MVAGGLHRGVARLEITKSGKRREVPMRQVVHGTLSGLPGPRLGRVWRSEGLRAGWERAVEEAKLDDFHFHDLRRHFASWYMMRGGSLRALQEVLGHADIKMTTTPRVQRKDQRKRSSLPRRFFRSP